MFYGVTHCRFNWHAVHHFYVWCVACTRGPSTFHATHTAVTLRAHNTNMAHATSDGDPPRLFRGSVGIVASCRHDLTQVAVGRVEHVFYASRLQSCILQVFATTTSLQHGLAQLLVTTNTAAYVRMCHLSLGGRWCSFGLGSALQVLERVGNC